MIIRIKKGSNLIIALITILFLAFPLHINAQEELLEKFGIEELTPEMKAMIAAFLKHRFEIIGTIKGTDDYESTPYPLQNANVQVYCEADTTQFGGGAADKDGKVKAYIFCRNKLKDLRVHVKISYIGMEPFDKVYTPTEGKDKIGDKLVVNLDTIVLKSNPVTLAEAEVIGELQKMYQRGDTTIFNAEAYEMPSGSVLLDLVRRLPGLRYEGGKMTYLGKDITEMRLNGDTFFKHDISVALQNMPHDKIKSLKVYEVPDDTLDVNSMDHLVMDMQTKIPVDNVDFANAKIGTTESFKNFLLEASGYTYVKGGAQVGINFSTSSLPNSDTPTKKKVNTNIGLSYERKFGNTTLDASLSHGYNRNDTQTEGFTQLFMPGFTQKTITESFNSSRGHNYGGNFNLDGIIKECTRWHMNLSLNSSDSKNMSSYSNDITNDSDANISSTMQSSVTTSNSKSASWIGVLTHKLGSEKKDEIGINASLNYGKSHSSNYSTTQSVFYQLGDSVQNTNYLISDPSENYGVNASAFYNHNFGKKNNIQLSYNVGYSNNKDKERYNNLDVNETYYLIDSLSYNKGNHTLAQGVKAALLIDNDWLNLKANMQVSHTRLVINNQRLDQDNYRSLYNSTLFNPSAHVKFKFAKGESTLELKYDGNNSMPSVSALSTATDYSDPMNIYMGNNHLKNQYTHNTGLELKYKALLRATFDYTSTENQTVMKTTLDPLTGARTTMPENINGNWSTREYLFLTKQIGQISLNAIALHSLSNNVGFVQTTDNSGVAKSATKYNNFNFVFIGGYTNANWITGIMALYNIDKSKNEYMSTSTSGNNLSTRFELRYTTTSGTWNFITNLTFQKKFGYELASANKTEYIWNASAEYKFLKGKRATLGLEWFDILNQHKGFEASMSETQWNETRTIGKTSYIQLTFAYRLSLFN